MCTKSKGRPVLFRSMLSSRKKIIIGQTILHIILLLMISIKVQHLIEQMNFSLESIGYCSFLPTDFSYTVQMITLFPVGKISNWSNSKLFTILQNTYDRQHTVGLNSNGCDQHRFINYSVEY